LKEPLGKPPKKSLLAIISGPEPQRSIFEEKILNLMPKSYEKRTLIRGIPKPIEEKTTNSDSVTINNHVPTAEMLKLIQGHSMIVARAGYSTIMDMYFLKKSICIVPTPGQNEQLYLARYHHMKRHYYIEQNNVSKIFETKTNIPINTSFQNEDEHFKESLIAQLITKNNSFINKK
jgi:UDP-N-acetylglucosamine transferase subunit ALG13